MTMGAVWLATWLALGSADMKWEPQASGTTVRLRGVSAVDSRVAWASGDKGTVVRTTDGGKTWTRAPVPDADGLDFRDVDAFSDRTAYVLSIGAGDKSRIYKTTDGGAHWTLQFTNTVPGAFFNGMAFWDEQHGIAFSDPVERHFVVITTEDGGATWKPVPQGALPAALEGEAGFAASGTSIAVYGKSHVWFGLGGSIARVLHSADRGKTWGIAPTPLATGEGAGVFSLYFWSSMAGVAVGGNYKQPEVATSNAALTMDAGKRKWTVPEKAPGGYRSCVAPFTPEKKMWLITVGPTGSDVSKDTGRTWEPLDTTGFHAVSTPPRKQDTAWAVGEEGRIAKLVFTSAAPAPKQP
ncbi:oxidoreductase [Corallococcus exiguus]|uniref:WD40/YVTN/BNR-like repeat-containing protein n=1 Tax=Corallococcus TaxID=83461 RepID=UPI000F8963A8|nr:MULTISPECIES: oxidoreductase [Corallococcus]NNC17756.1 oxidoreductase [Corallococcus exiguus]NRD66774.1 oxidoreductase [Corallococcus exiguus]RUO92586.1 oxidoreductase [Corallococcus sp. AB018]